MFCWRDLTKKCVEEDCPMWMPRFELSNVVEPEEIGLNESKCALVFKEKLGVMKTMVEILNSMDDLPMFDLFDSGDEMEMADREEAGPKARLPPHGTEGKKSKKSPVAKKKQTPPGK